MNRQQAIEAVQEGKIISHERFLPHEYVYVTDGFFYDERDVVIPYDDYWENRMGKVFNEGWFIVEMVKLKPLRFTKDQIVKEIQHILESGANEMRLLGLIEKIQDDAIDQGRLLQINLRQAFENGKKELERTVAH